MSATDPGWERRAGRLVISVDDPRLNRLLVRYPYRYATLSEYAAASGIGVDVVTAQLGPYLDIGTLGLETAGGEIFVLTAPTGRPVPPTVPDVAPNLWEVLRIGATVPDAYEAWATARSLERAGWDVTADPELVHGSLGYVTRVPRLGLRIGTAVVPVVTGASPAALAEPTGLLGEYERAGTPAVAVVCAGGQLDAATTAVRRWVISRQAMPTYITVIVLEQPSLAPVLMSAVDAAVTPVSVDRSTLATLNWAHGK